MASGSMAGDPFHGLGNWILKCDLRAGKPTRRSALPRKLAAREGAERLEVRVTGSIEACTRRTHDSGQPGRESVDTTNSSPAASRRRERVRRTRNLGNWASGTWTRRTCPMGHYRAGVVAETNSSRGQPWGERVATQTHSRGATTRGERRGTGASNGKPDDKPVRTKPPSWVTKGVAKSWRPKSPCRYRAR